MDVANCTLLAETLKDGNTVMLVQRNNCFSLVKAQPDQPQLGTLEGVVSYATDPISPTEARRFYETASIQHVDDDEFRSMISAAG